MDDSFLRSYVHRDHWLLGRRLAPYSASHALLLHALQSPLTTSEPVGLEDLLIAARICAHRDPLQIVAGPHPRICKSDWLRPGLVDVFEKILCRRFPFLIRAALRAWEGYMHTWSGAPEYYQQEQGDSSGRRLTGPYLLVLIGKYRKAYGAPRAEAWLLPLPALRWEIAESDEIDGDERRFVDETDLEAEDDLPDLAELDEQQQYKLALEHLGPQGAAAWRAARENQREGGAI